MAFCIVGSASSAVAVEADTVTEAVLIESNHALVIMHWLM
jgi:hypothetical protein